jgi:dTDP-4-amino-4,6-dideoxygalactose transaminase
LYQEIKFLDLYAINKLHEKEITAAIAKVIQSGWYILGKSVVDFENAYADFSQAKYCAGVANGLDALILSLKVLGIQPGDEVIVPSNTYIASWLAVSHIGAIPVPVEPDINTYNIDPDLIEKAITKHTKAVMVVNLYGQAAELLRIKKITDSYGIYLVEDNAQSQGAFAENTPTGSVGILNGTSFYPGKNLGALGDAGAITTNDEYLFKQIKTFRNYGSEVKYYNVVKGFNSRLDELQAEILLAKLKYLHEENDYRNICAQTYNGILGSCNQVILPAVAENCTSVYHVYMIRTHKRDELQKYLLSKNIHTMVHYPVPPHLQTAYTDLGYKKNSFPIAEEIAETCLSLPIGQHLSQEDICTVGNMISDFFKQNS